MLMEANLLGCYRAAPKAYRHCCVSELFMMRPNLDTRIIVQKQYSYQSESLNTYFLW